MLLPRYPLVTFCQEPFAACQPREVGHKVQRLIRGGQCSTGEGHITLVGEQTKIAALEFNRFIFRNRAAIEPRAKITCSIIGNL